MNHHHLVKWRVQGKTRRRDKIGTGLDAVQPTWERATKEFACPSEVEFVEAVALAERVLLSGHTAETHDVELGTLLKIMGEGYPETIQVFVKEGDDAERTAEAAEGPGVP